MHFEFSVKKNEKCENTLYIQVSLYKNLDAVVQGKTKISVEDFNDSSWALTFIENLVNTALKLAVEQGEIKE